MNTSNSIFPQSDDRLFPYLLKETLKGLFDDLTQEPVQPKNPDKLPILILGLFLVVVTEPLKVLLRKNIGIRALSMPRLIVACVLYLIWAFVIYKATDDDFENYTVGLYAGCVFYILFAFFIFILGVQESSNAEIVYGKNQSDIPRSFYRGDSVFFRRFLDNGGESQIKKVWLIIEPRFCFCISLTLTILLALVHPVFLMIGLPLLITTISFWFNEWFQIENVWDMQAKKKSREEEKVDRNTNRDNEDFFNLN